MDQVAAELVQLEEMPLALLAQVVMDRHRLLQEHPLLMQVVVVALDITKQVQLVEQVAVALAVAVVVTELLELQI
jgi:hypothetical protein